MERAATTRARTFPLAKIVVLAVVAAGLLVAHRLGVIQRFADPSQLKSALLDLGPWGLVTFVAAYAALQPFGVPGTVFVFAAPLIWPWPVAYAVSMAGTMAASVVGFAFARFVARDWVAARVPPRFATYDEALARHGFATVVALRFVFWMPQVLHGFLGVSRVPFWTHFWGSLVGYAVPLLLATWFGETMFQAAREVSPAGWIGAGVAAVALGSIAWLLRHRSRRPVPRLECDEQR
jgi:uncharacterized membrane protein YdjX (TVP38/TMEM64 family)